MSSKNRRATYPLDEDAVRAANAAVGGRKLTMSAGEYPDRKKWMDAYIASGGEWENADRAGLDVGQVMKPCPQAGLPESLPKTCADAQSEVKLPSDVNNAMKTSFGNSFPSGRSQERGGTIVKDANGIIRVVNERSGTSGTMRPNRTVGSGETIIGTYHTHPYDASEGSHKGVSLSGADIAYANYYQEPTYVDAGTKQFMVMPSQNTKATAAEINKDWDAEFNRRLKAGESIQNASAGATNHVAKKNDMAYYEGSNGSLKKVSC